MEFFFGSSWHDESRVHCHSQMCGAISRTEALHLRKIKQKTWQAGCCPHFFTLMQNYLSCTPIRYTDSPQSSPYTRSCQSQLVPRICLKIAPSHQSTGQRKSARSVSFCCVYAQLDSGPLSRSAFLRLVSVWSGLECLPCTFRTAIAVLVFDLQLPASGHVKVTGTSS